MKSTVAAFVIAFLISAMSTPIVRRLAIRAGALDEAGGRRVHTGRIPRLGGLAVAVAFFVPLVALFMLDSSLGRRFFEDPGRIIGLALGAAMVLVLGGLDDLKGVRPRNKLLVQSCAALVAWLGGYEISSIALPFVPGRLDLGYFSVPLTVLWFVGLINALNLIDGLDGLAAGIAFFACMTNLVVGTVNESVLVVLLSGALAGALLGFLVYNFNPASIFMGDSGSMFLGFVLAATSMLGSTIKSSTTVAILVPMLALGVPITDTVWALARRVRQGRSIFSADRGHIHHLLLDLGLSQRRAVILLYTISLTLTVAAAALALDQSLTAGGAVILMSIMLVAIVRTARSFALDQGPPIRQRARLPVVEELRHRIPDLLMALQRARVACEAVVLVEDLARLSGIPACSISLPEQLGYAPGPSTVPAAPCSPVVHARRIVFSLDQLGHEAQLVFRLHGPVNNDQTHILLQLVADGLERCLCKLLTESSSPAERATNSGAVSDVAGHAVRLRSAESSTV